MVKPGNFSFIANFVRQLRSDQNLQGMKCYPSVYGFIVSHCKDPCERISISWNVMTALLPLLNCGLGLLLMEIGSNGCFPGSTSSTITFQVGSMVACSVVQPHYTIFELSACETSPLFQTSSCFHRCFLSTPRNLGMNSHKPGTAVLTKCGDPPRSTFFLQQTTP